MNARTKRSLDRYFKDYRDLIAKCEAAKVRDRSGFVDFFNRLRKDIPALQRSRRRTELLYAPRFNIFKVLPVERRETLLHSPLFANLLDPLGSHGQGCLFLGTFFEVARRNAHLVPPKEPLEPNDWSVRSEVYIGNGSIDLLVESQKQSYVLIIENKIDALEQQSQLSRYHKWLRERRGDFAFRQLVFLTPTGRPSELSPRIPCALMSYGRDIRELMKLTMSQIRPYHLKQLLGQYLAVLNDWAEEAYEYTAR
jgi:hypothetical protein